MGVRFLLSVIARKPLLIKQFAVIENLLLTLNYEFIMREFLPADLVLLLKFIRIIYTNKL